MDPPPRINFICPKCNHDKYWLAKEPINLLWLPIYICQKCDYELSAYKK
jgi:hypothetical protein